MKALIAGALLLGGCAAGTGTSDGVPLPTASFRAEDRVVLGDFATVQAIATSLERVYVVYRSAVAIRDPVSNRWQVPHQAPAPDALARVGHALIDPLDHSLWMGGADGLIHFDPMMERWDHTPVGGSVTALAIDRRDPAGGIWVGTQSGWLVIRMGAQPTPATPPATLQAPPTLEDLYQDLPMLRGMGQMVALGPGMQPGRITAVAPVGGSGDWLVGTDRNGLLKFDRFSINPTPLSPGLPGDIVGAIAAVPGGVWVATDEDRSRGTPAALTFVPDDLSGSEFHFGDAALGLGLSAIRRIVPGDRALWLASDRGLARFDIDTDDVEWWGEARGLRDQRVLTAHRWQDGILLGTMAGVTFLDAVGETSMPAPGLIDPAYALFAWRDTIWIGTGRGLMTLAAGDDAAAVAAGWRANSAAYRPVIGVGLVADTLVAMTRELLVRRDPLTGEWIAGAPTAAATGLLRAFHATPFGAWIGGDRGAVFVTASGIPLHTLMVGRELPGAVTAITATPGLLWVGTTRGLVRLVLRD